MHTLSLSLSKMAMAGGATAAIEVLLQNLIDICMEEISLIRGLGKEALQLKTTLALIESYLNDAEKKLITQDAVKIWLGELEDVAFRADNVLDELNYHLLRKKVNKMKKITEKVPSFFSLPDRNRMAHSIKRINMDFDSLHRKATVLRLESIFIDAPPPSHHHAAFETDSFIVDPIFIGRDDDFPKLVDMLLQYPVERMFSVLSIVGMGGMGKTTLTRKVFNHQKIISQYGSLIWVHVSQYFDSTTLLKKILTEVLKQTDAVENRQDVMKKLKYVLKSQTYLLILDDVWNQDLRKWEDFLNSLAGVTSMKGNGIIITTRNTEVASIANPYYIHHLNGLSDKDCWAIIKAKAFQSRDIVPPEFEIIGGKIARRCKGLPLAANVVGGVLRDKSEQEWLFIEHNWLSNVEGDNILKILRLSFDSLSSPSIKKCFTYCSVFPKGDKFGRQELIELWMAEGLLQPDRRDDMESVGDKFVNVLLQNSLLQLTILYGTIKCLSMHDLVHDLASSLKVDGNNSDCTSRVRYMSQSSPIPEEAAKCLRTLFLDGEISYINFSYFKCLHALTLLSYQVMELPSSIGKLIHLRNLNISRTGIKYLPDSIGELHHLQTLRVKTPNLKKLPYTVKYLISLRHLYFDDEVKLPPEMGRLTCLQTLTHFTVGKEEGCRIEELGCLKNLKGKLKIYNLEQVHGREEAEKANIFDNPNLFELAFHWNMRVEGHGNDHDEKVLEGLQPHPNLRKLDIVGFEGKRFPLWCVKMAVKDEVLGSWIGLAKLTDIRLQDCSECEEIPTLGHLPNLKSLSLQNLRNVKSVNTLFYGKDNETTTIVFPALVELAMTDLYGLREWGDVECNGEVKIFPHLENLSIKNCHKLMSVPSYFSSLTDILLEGLDGLEYLPVWLFHNNQDLKVFRIRQCLKLRALPNGLHTLNSLEMLHIGDCRNLNSMGGGQSRGLLRWLIIERCPGLVDLPSEMLESWAPSLEVLSLIELRSLKNLYMIIDCVQAKSARLTELRIVGVPKFMASSKFESWPFRSLRELKIDVSMDWWSRDSSVGIEEAVNGMLQACCHSLAWLYLKGIEIWESLPESMQNLTALSWLNLSNLGIQELPEWFGNASSLRSLELYSCRKLRRLPSVDAFASLEFLRINDCPELCIDPEWRNIHQLRINVDGHEIETWSWRNDDVSSNTRSQDLCRCFPYRITT